jgi:hypothetical protein
LEFVGRREERARSIEGEVSIAWIVENVWERCWVTAPPPRYCQPVRARRHRKCSPLRSRVRYSNVSSVINRLGGARAKLTATNLQDVHLGHIVLRQSSLFKRINNTIMTDNCRLLPVMRRSSAIHQCIRPSEDHVVRLSRAYERGNGPGKRSG